MRYMRNSYIAAAPSARWRRMICPASTPVPSAVALFQPVTHLFLLLGGEAVVEVGQGSDHLGPVALHGLCLLLQQGLGAGAVKFVTGDQGLEIGPRISTLATQGRALGDDFIGQHGQLLFLGIVETKLAADPVDHLGSRLGDVLLAPVVTITMRAGRQAADEDGSAKDANEGFLEPGFHDGRPLRDVVEHVRHDAGAWPARGLSGVSIYFVLYQRWRLKIFGIDFAVDLRVVAAACDSVLVDQRIEPGH